MTKEWNRFGALIPPVNITVEPEFNEWAPEGVTIHTQRMWRQRAVMSEEDLRDMDKYLDDDCHRLAFAKPHFVMYACTSGSSLETGGYDKKISDRISKESGVPASTTSTAVSEALRTMGVKDVAVVTPYPQAVNEKEMAFFADLGFNPVSLESFLEGNSYNIPLIPQCDTYEMAKAADRPDAEGVFISCTNLATSDIIERLEQDLGKPVITSNHATMWYGLRSMGVDDVVHNAGKLLTMPLTVTSVA